jgi:hypothetical protein
MTYQKATKEQLADLDKIVEELAGLRVKRNCDYAMLVKYGEIHVFCSTIWTEAIQEVFEKFEVPFNHHPY